MRRNPFCSTNIYVFPVIEKNTLVGITLFYITVLNYNYRSK